MSRAALTRAAVLSAAALVLALVVFRPEPAARHAGAPIPASSPATATGEPVVDASAGRARPVAAPAEAPDTPRAAAGAAAAPGPPTSTPIRHFVTMLQEEHSFDNYFGTYPGADGIPAGTCMPIVPGDPAKGCVKPFAMAGRPSEAIGSSPGLFAAEFNLGAMNGFVSGPSRGAVVDDIAMGHYDDRDLPYYWNLAGDYVLFDRFFSAAAGGSVWNHMYWVTASPGNPSHDLVAADGWGDLPTIFDRLQAKGISWKFYIQNYDPRRTIRAAGKEAHGAQVIRAPLLAYPRYLDDPALFSHIVPLDQYYKDAAAGTLPAVSYIVPAGNSEHPPGSVQNGSRLVQGVISSLQASPQWSSSAFLLSYASWGGWYDHVAPPRLDPYGDGFRVPAILVSPYARRGYVDSTTLDTASIPKFIEQNWGLAPLATRDAAAATFTDAFDFAAPPRPAAFTSTVRNPVLTPQPNRAIIYLTYGGALALAVVLVAAGAWVAFAEAIESRGVGVKGVARATVSLRGAVALAALLAVSFVAGPVLAATPGAPAPPPPRAPATAGLRPVTIETVPPVAGASFNLQGQVLTTDSTGTAKTVVTKAARDALQANRDANLTIVDPTVPISSTVRAQFAGWAGGGQYHYSRAQTTGEIQTATFDLDYLTTFSFVDARGTAIDPSRIESMTLDGSTGGVISMRAPAPVWLRARTAVQANGSQSGNLEVKDVSYAIGAVEIEGTNVVNHDQQRFYPTRQPAVAVRVLFFDVRFRGRDALLGGAEGEALMLRYPNGRVQRYPFGRDASVVVRHLPRGSYKAWVQGAAYKLVQPLSISRNQTADLKVVTSKDLLLAAGLAFVVVAGLLVFGLGRRRRRRRADRERADGGADTDRGGDGGGGSTTAPDPRRESVGAR